MLFNSYVFIFIFLPITVILYFLCNKIINQEAGVLLLITASLFFYGFNHPRYVLLLLLSIILNFWLGKWICILHKKNKQRGAMHVCITGIICNVGILFYYKYYSFFLFNFNIFMKTDFGIPNIVLPLGISFFTFQQISFLVDTYTQKVTQYSFWQYASFVSFFPQLVAGPIVLHDEYIPQIQEQDNKNPNSNNLLQGILRFTYGLSKKVLIADMLAIPVNYGYANIEQLSSLDAIVLMISFTFQLYFDFSAYSDMAIGIGYMFNIVLPNNFDSPLRSLSIPEFWKRWHMTLGRFLTSYIYIPLGGNRKGKIRTYWNVFVVFLISGIWHGANYTFILWGILHGIFSILYRINRKWYDKLPKIIRWMCTYLTVVVLFGLFRADGLKDWLRLLQKILVEKNYVFTESFVSQYMFKDILFMAKVFSIPIFETAEYLSCVVVLLICFCITLLGQNMNSREMKSGAINLFIAAGVLVWCIFSLGQISTFLYFNF